MPYIQTHSDSLLSFLLANRDKAELENTDFAQIRKMVESGANPLVGYENRPYLFELALGRVIN